MRHYYSHKNTINPLINPAIFKIKGKTNERITNGAAKIIIALRFEKLSSVYAKKYSL